MKLIAAMLVLLFTLPAFAAQGRRKSDQEIIQSFRQNGPWMIPLAKIYEVREKLIRKYVLGTHQIAAVSACGEEDLMGAEENYICVYVFSDSSKQVMQEMFDGEPSGKVDGVRIVVTNVDRKK